MRLQDCGGIAWFFRKHRGEVFATAKGFCSSARLRRKRTLCGPSQRKIQTQDVTIHGELNEAKIERLLRKWLARLPHPYPAKDRAAGFRYEIFMQQVEFARTLVLDYKRSSIRQYFKMGRALRTELTVNNTRDFGIGKALHNLPALREVAFAANRRLLHVQKLSHDPMVLAVLTALLMFRFLPQGFRNGALFSIANLRRDVSQLLARPAHDLSPGQMTYQLRRLRLRGLIKRIPGTQRYEVTDTGQRMAVFWLGSLSQTIRPLATTVSDVTLQEQILNTLRKTLQKHSIHKPISKT